MEGRKTQREREKGYGVRGGWKSEREQGRDKKVSVKAGRRGVEEEGKARL